MISLLNKKIPVFVTFMLLVVTSLTTFFIVRNHDNKEKSDAVEIASVNSSSVNPSSIATNTGCNVYRKSMEGFGYIKPLIYADKNCESEKFSSVKQDVNQMIDEFKRQGIINSASVYIKDFGQNEWMAINEKEKYKPGSLLKVPELITFLKMNELHPGLLDKELLYEHPFSTTKNPVYLSQSIQLGHKYTIRQLLTYMIAYSDNNATLLLNANIDVSVFKKVFTDLGLQAPDWNSNDYPITVRDYSLFLRILYRATYLSLEDSEFATELLSKCDFKEGIARSLPSTTRLAHKFGEAGDSNENQLHESGIIYIDDAPYLITIMTKGKDLQKLPEVISQISQKVYSKMLNKV